MTAAIHTADLHQFATTDINHNKHCLTSFFWLFPGTTFVKQNLPTMYPGNATNKKIIKAETNILPFKQMANSTSTPAEVLLLPAVNITETTTEYLLEIATPGMHREDFSIEIEQSVISISAKSEKNTDTDCVSDRCEYNYTQWTRAFALPEDADVVLAHAKYSNGELSIRIPRGNTTENQAKAIVYVY